MNKSSPLPMLAVVYNFRVTVSTTGKFTCLSKENVNINKLINGIFKGRSTY